MINIFSIHNLLFFLITIISIYLFFLVFFNSLKIGSKRIFIQLSITIISIILYLDVMIFSNNIMMQLLKSGVLIIFLYFSKEFVKSIKNKKEAKKELEDTHKKIKALLVLNKNLKVINIKLENILEVKNEFLHIVSHQLRTPLTAMRGMISMWYDGDFNNLSEKEKKKIIKNIFISSERLNNMANDMFDSLELEGGSLKFKFKSLSIIKILRETINTLKYNFNEKGIYIKLETERDVPNAEVDPNYIGQVFMNIIDNACKYTKKGGIKISVKKDGKFVKVIIKDTGIGISKANQKKIFEKFFRSKNAINQNPSGTGLGLFIVRKIVRAHNGKIEIESEGIGKGSIIKIFLMIKHNK